MKKFVTIITGLLMAVALMAETPERMSVEELFKTYAGTAGTESTMLNQSTLKSLADKKGTSRKTARLLKSLDRIWAISTAGDNEGFLEDAKLTTESRKDYQIVSNTNKNGSQTTFYMSEKAPKSLILISVSETKISYMEIRGDFSLLDFGSLSEIGIR